MNKAGADHPEPPPFQPDPDLAWYLEGGDPARAARDMREALEREAASKK